MEQDIQKKLDDIKAITEKNTPVTTPPSRDKLLAQVVEDLHQVATWFSKDLAAVFPKHINTALNRIANNIKDLANSRED